MSKFYKLKVSDVRKETPHAVSIAFEITNALRTVFAFKPGQYINVRLQITGEDVRRSYSICSTPESGELRIAVKKVPGGKFSTYANDSLKVGDNLEVMPPEGKFVTDYDAQRKTPYVFFAAGSGITPVISLVESLLLREPQSHITLIYGNRTSESTIFRDRLSGLKNQFLERLSIHHVMSRERQSSELYTGRINAEKCRQFAQVFFVPKDVRRYFICGPEEMIFAVKDCLVTLGVKENKIFFELFTTPQSRGFIAQEEIQEDDLSDIDREKEAAVTVRLDGDAMDFGLPYAGQNILDAAIEAGVDAPFSCKGGVCCTCKAMLLEGEVKMDTVWGLEPDEIDDGFILTCQSHPRSEKILVDYDIR